MVITHFSRSPSTPQFFSWPWTWYWIISNASQLVIEYFEAIILSFLMESSLIRMSKGAFESTLLSPDSWSYWTTQPQPNQYDFPSPFRQSSWPLRETDTDHVWNISFQSDLTDVKSGPLVIWKFPAMALCVVADNDMFLLAMMMMMILSWGFLFCISPAPTWIDI